MFEEERAELLRFKEEAIQKEREIKRRKHEELSQLRRFVELRLSEIQVYEDIFADVKCTCVIARNRLKNKLKNYKDNKEHCCVLPVPLLMGLLLDNTSPILTIPVSILIHLPQFLMPLHTIYNLNTVPHHLMNLNPILSTTVHHPKFSNSKLNTMPWRSALNHRTILTMW